MSTALAHALPAPRREEAPRPEPQRRLRALERPARRKRPRIVYAVTAILGVALVAAMQIALSLAITQDSFVLKDLRIEQRELSLQLDALGTQLSGLNSPQYLAANAGALGMVAAASPGYIRLSDGQTFGQASGAAAAGVSTNMVGNALVAEQPLIVAPDATIGGLGAAAEEATEQGAPPAVAPTLTNGLPSPNTH